MEAVEQAEELLASLEAEVQAADKGEQPEDNKPANYEGTAASAEYDPFVEAATGGDGGGQAGKDNGEEAIGDASASASASAAATSTVTASGEKKRRRRKSRFDSGPAAGDGDATPRADVPATANDEEGRANEKDGGEAVEGEEGGDDKVTGKRKRRSRWGNAGDKGSDNASKPRVDLAMMASMVAGQISGAAGFETSADPQVQALQAELSEINRRLMSGDAETLVGGEDEDRSPSPEPEYDAMGKRTNTREIRIRNKLQDRRSDVISKLIKADPKYRPPLDYRPLRKNRKIYIPVNEFPGYNFIGLIIGPRGNTQKRMEKETRCKIAIRGKGAVKEGRASKGGPGGQAADPYAHEDLHVFIQGECEEDVNAAAEMIEKLLEPQNEELNDHKKEQLRELALMNGTLREDYQSTSNSIIAAAAASGSETDIIAVAKEEAFQLPAEIQKKANEQYKRDIIRMGGDAEEMEREYKSFLQELGGDDGTAGPLQELEAKTAAERAMEAKARSRGPDEANIYVSGFPLSINNDGLRALFSRFGEISECRVVLDRGTGQSRGFGFVRFWEVAHAQQAVQSMNGYRMEDKFLTVRIAGAKGSMHMGHRRPMMPNMGMYPPGMGYPNNMPPMPTMPPPPHMEMYPGMYREMWMPPPFGPEAYPRNMPPMMPGQAGPGPGSAGAGHDMSATAPPAPGTHQDMGMRGPGQTAMPPMPPMPLMPPMPPMPPIPPMPSPYSSLQHAPVAPASDQMPPPPSQPAMPPNPAPPGDTPNTAPVQPAEPSVENEYEKFMAELG